MMKLYYAPGACSLSCHIALEESGIPFQTKRVEYEAFDTSDATYKEMEKYNPLGCVPTLITDEGKALTQNVAILTYLADQAPKSGLLPAPGTYDRAKAMEWLSFIGADLHKSFGPLFGLDSFTNKTTQEDLKKHATARLHDHLMYVDTHMKGKDYVLGKTYSVADAYLFTVYNWCRFVEMPTDAYSNLNTFKTRVFERAATQKAMKSEGLLDKK